MTPQQSNREASNPATTAPLRLKRLARADMEALNRIYQIHFVARWSLFDNPLTLHVPAEPPEDFRAVLAVTCELNATRKRFVVEFADFPLNQWVYDALNGVCFEELPHPLQLSIMEEAFGELCTKLGRGLAEIVRLVGFSLPPVDGSVWDRMIPALVCRRYNGARYCSASRIRSDADTIKRLCALFAGTASAEGEWGPMLPRLRGVLSAGRAFLTIVEMQNLEPGDIILAAERSFVMRFLQLRVTLKPFDTKNFTVEGCMNTPASPTPSVGAELPDIRNLNFEISFDVGTKRFTVAEAEALRPGMVLSLDASPDGPVTLRIDQTVIGTGTLVEVDNRLGCRISSIFGRELASISRSPGEEPDPQECPDDSEPPDENRSQDT